MIPILYEKTALSPDSEGLGRLADAVDVIAQGDLTGLGELSFSYPVNSRMFSQIMLNRIVGALPYKGASALELYDIYKISTPAQGSISVKARHISYRLLGQICAPFTATSASDAMQKLANNVISGTDTTQFTYGIALGQDVTDPEKTYELKEPRAVRTVLAEIANVYGGWIKYTGLSAILQIGTEINRGAVISYDKNMLSMSYDLNTGDMYTHVLVWYYAPPEYEDEPETALNAYALLEMVSGVSDAEKKTMVADVTSAIDAQAAANDETVRDFPEEYLSQENLLLAGQQFITNNKDVIAAPVISTTVSHLELGEQPAQPGDIITVLHPNFAGDIGARMSAWRFNVLLEQYDSATLGQPGNSLENALACVLSYMPQHADDWYNFGPRLGTPVESSGGGDGTKHWWGTRAEYAAMSEHDAETVYLIYAESSDFVT